MMRCFSFSEPNLEPSGALHLHKDDIEVNRRPFEVHLSRCFLNESTCVIWHIGQLLKPMVLGGCLYVEVDQLGTHGTHVPLQHV